ncbi:hypothetical protein F5X98DRAFT_86085 [Xylaria grammica]|nr:hypothetical protein F5X98DRAFT_86085 [Xylaria grammica]
METIDLSDPTFHGLLTNVDMYLSIICACLPVLYGLFRTSSRGISPQIRKLGGASSTRKTYTFGNIGGSSNRSDLNYHSAYQVLCERGLDGATRSMAPLDPVVVRTGYSVTAQSNIGHSYN